jgi:hypothetical protein
MLAAFFMGCIATEIWWMGKMRRLRGQIEMEMAQAEKTVSADATAARVYGVRPEAGTEQSLLGLQQHLSEKKEESPVPQNSSKA